MIHHESLHKYHKSDPKWSKWANQSNIKQIIKPIQQHHPMFPSDAFPSRYWATKHVPFACEEVIGQQVGVAFDLIDSKMAEVGFWLKKDQPLGFKWFL